MKKRQVSSNLSDNSFGVASVVFSVLSIMFYLYEGVILGILGLIFALKQRSISNNRWAYAALIISVIGIIFSVVSIILGYSSISSNIIPIQNSVNP